MPPCKFCSAEIVWVQKSGDPKPKPYNASDLTPHECEASKQAYAAKKGNGGGYSGPRSDPVVIARQSSLKVAADIVLKGANSDTRPTDIITEDIINIARILTRFVQEG